MDSSIHRNIAKIISSLSEHFGISFEDEVKIANFLKKPTQVRGMQLQRHLKRLSVMLKSTNRIEAFFWRTVKRYIKNAEKILAGQEITQLRVMIPESFKLLDDPKDIRSVLKSADVQFPVPFWFAVPEIFKNYVHKVTEGSFSDVYKIIKRNGETRILKIIPLRNVPEENFTRPTLRDVSSEMHVASELSKLSKGSTYRCSTFPKVYSVCVVQDAFPESLKSAWEAYNSRRTSLHTHPSLYRTTQSFVTIEMENAGTCLNSFKIVDYLLALSIFQQVSTALAIAEESLSFEHRDLHSENILLTQCDEETIPIRIKSRNYRIRTFGMKVTLIDFTFSRVTTDGVVKYVDIEPLYYPNPSSKRKLLDHRYIYAKMAEVTEHKWKSFCPRTNLLWLQHVLKHLLYRARQHKPLLFQDWQKKAMKTLKTYESTCMMYDSTTEFVQEEIIHTL